MNKCILGGCTLGGRFGVQVFEEVAEGYLSVGYIFSVYIHLPEMLTWYKYE